MTLAAVSEHEAVATFTTPDRETFKKRAQEWGERVPRRDDAMRRHGALQGGVRDCPLWHAHFRLVDLLERRIVRLERSLTNALASDALEDDQRYRIILAVHGTKARDANLPQRLGGREPEGVPGTR
jgi:hypothetical protein